MARIPMTEGIKSLFGLPPIMPVDNTPIMPGIGPSDMWALINRDTEPLRQQILAQQAQAQLGAQAGAAPQMPNPVPTEREKLAKLASRAREHFVARMGGVRGTFFVHDTDCVYTHINGDTVVLFYCFSGKVGHVEEQVDKFPSDQLIAQFRMILA